MKRILALVALSASLASAATYFVSNAGSDSNNGTSTGTPWQHISKVNGSTFAAGDTISFNRGDKWDATDSGISSGGGLTILQAGSSGNPITVTAYGTGAKPIISGGLTQTGFSSISGNRWTVALTTQPLVVTIAGTFGTVVASQAAVVSSGQWFWGSNVLTVFSLTDPSGNVEAGQKWPVIQVQSSGFVTFDNLECRMANSNAANGACILGNRAGTQTAIRVTNSLIDYCAGIGIKLADMNNSVVDSSTIAYIGQPGVGLSSNGNQHGIFFAVQTVGTFSGNQITNSTIHDVVGDGMWIASNGQTYVQSGLVVTGNNSYANANGLYLLFTTGAVVHDNQFHDNVHYASYDTPPFQDVYENYGIGMEATLNSLIYSNLIQNNTNEGIALVGCPTTMNCSAVGNADGNQIYINIISGHTTAQAAGVVIESSDLNTGYTNSNSVFNNLFYGNGGAVRIGHGGTANLVANNVIYGNTQYGLTTVGGTNIGYTIKNNIFSGQSGVPDFTDGGATTTGVTHTNNLFYHPSGNSIVWNGSTFTQATATSFEATSAVGDPLFVSAPSNFRIGAGSPAIGAGANLTSLAITALDSDYAGVGRPSSGAWVDGAFNVSGGSVCSNCRIAGSVIIQ